VLTTAENGPFAKAMLVDLAGRLVPGWTLTEPDEDLLGRVVYCSPQGASGAHPGGGPPQQAREVQAEVSAWLEFVRAQRGADLAVIELFEQIALQLTNHFLLIVEHDESVVGSRTVLKYSYDEAPPEPLTRRVPASLKLEPTDFGFSESWHFEVEAPEGLVLKRLELTEYDLNGDVLAAGRDEGASSETVGHLAHRPAHRLTSAVVTIDLAPDAPGVPRFALFGVLLTTVAVWVALVARAFPGLLVAPTTVAPSPAASILLAGPALLLSWISRAPEHTMVARLLRRTRRTMMVSALVLLVMAALTAVPVVRWVGCVAWLLVGIAQTWVAFDVVQEYRDIVSESPPTVVTTRGGAA